VAGRRGWLLRKLAVQGVEGGVAEWRLLQQDHRRLRTRIEYSQLSSAPFLIPYDTVCLRRTLIKDSIHSFASSMSIELYEEKDCRTPHFSGVGVAKHIIFSDHRARIDIPGDQVCQAFNHIHTSRKLVHLMFTANNASAMPLESSNSLSSISRPTCPLRQFYPMKRDAH
jgi:hypothetical protein